MRKFLLTTVAVGFAGYATAAHAVAYSSPASLSLVDFGTASSVGLQTTTSSGTIGGETFVFTTAGTPSTGIYAGSTPNTAVTPFGGSSLTDYLAVEPGGSVVINFSTPQTSFALLWGTVDTYNSLTFTAGGTVVGGSAVATALGFPANGTVNENVLISGLPTFTSILVQSSTAAFEFVPGTALAVPEPMSLALFGTGLLGLGLIGRRQSGRMGG